jgi:hypothetical protein
MLTAFLAGTGSRVLIPDAVAVVPGPTEEEVYFVDGEGKVLVVFRRADLAVYTGDGALPSRAEEEPAEPDGH